MLKYVNKTMQMSGTTRCGGCGCGCGSSYRLRILRQLALSMRIPSSSLMCANRAVRAASQAKHLTIINNRVVCDFRVELRTWRGGTSGDRRLTGHTYLPTMCVCVWRERMSRKSTEIKSAGWQAYIFITLCWKVGKAVEGEGRSTRHGLNVSNVCAPFD